MRHPDVFAASLRHHADRVIGRPIRTAIVIVIAYVMVVALATFTNDPEGTREFTSGEELSVEAIVPLLPPTTVLLVLAGAAIVGVPIGLIVQGVRRDLNSPTRRRQRRDQEQRRD